MRIARFHLLRPKCSFLRVLPYCLSVLVGVCAVSSSVSLLSAVRFAPRSALQFIMPGAAAGGAPPSTDVVEATRKSRRRRATADGGAGDEDAKAAGGKNEYECRFCLMKFEKSQALGGHMNRHRQEREKEQFQHAQQIVSSAAQQQMPRKWSSLSAEMTQSPSAPSGSNTILNNHLSGGANRQQYVAPPISFPTQYWPTSPTNCNPGMQLPPSPGSTHNCYPPSNASSCNISSNMQNQHNQQLQWIGSMDGLSNAASNSPRSVSFHHPHPVENNVAISLQAAGVSSEFLANMLRSSSIPNDGNPMHASPSTPTSSQQAPATYDVNYNSQLTNAFYNRGM